MSKKEYKKPRGTQDFLPEFMNKWNFVVDIWKEISRDYGYEEIVTPVFENTELFSRTAGETSDIVTKEMYTFLDKGNRSITLKPEGTASVVRAYFENKLHKGSQPVKFSYIMPMFRYERPQAGRFRQHHQYGVENLGKRSPYIDAEVISLLINFYRKIGILEPKVWINSLGCTSCRIKYREKLINFLDNKKDQLCEQCNIRLEKNPLRVLDCKNVSCKSIIIEAPAIVDILCDDCSKDYNTVKKVLEFQKIPYEEKTNLVRGLDYYNGTVFEVVAKGLSEKDVIAGGGRYDSLMEEIGGVKSSAFGAGAGLERLIKTIEEQELEIKIKDKIRIPVISLDNEIDTEVFAIVNNLRNNGFRTEFYESTFKLKRVMKKLIQNNYNFIIIIGSDEIMDNSITFKDLKTFDQKKVKIDELETYIKGVIQ